MQRKQWRPLLVLPLAATMALAGCGSGDEDDPGEAQAQAELKRSAAPEVVEEPAQTEGATPTGEPAGPVPTPVGPSPNPTPLPPAAGPLEIELEDVFLAEGGWSEDRYNVANRSDLLAMGASVICARNSPSLELRLEQRFDTLRFEVGQANSSPNSQQTVVVTVMGNGEQIDTREVEFNEVQMLEIDAANLNAVIVKFDLVRDECDYGRESIIVVDNMQVI